MVANHVCAQAEQLRRFLDERLSVEEETALVRHLDTCKICRERLESAAGDREDWNALGESLRLPRSANVDSARAQTEEDESDAATREAASLHFLAPTDDPAMLGRLGTYEVIGVIGYGGMGTVLKAFDRALNRNVAIKVLAPQLATSGSARRRFAREAQAAAAVVHEHVVAIHAVAEANGLPYLVMPYVSGESLQQRIDRTGPLGVPEILRIGMQTASGLAAAHAQGLVHRDIKPANILLENGVERVMITDFGLARAMDDASLTRSGVIAGTPQYMAPEQAQGETVDHRADLFSLGSVMYAMGTGHSPFRAETAMAVLRRVCEQRPRPIREVNPEVPEWLAEIIDRLLAKQPGHRFGDAAEVARLLEKHLAHLQHPTNVPMPPRLATVPSGDPQKRSASRRFRAWVQAPTRRPVAVGVTLAGLAVVVGAVLGTISYLGSPAGVGALPASSAGGRSDTETSGRRAASLPSRDDQRSRALEGPEWEEEVSRIRERIGEVDKTWFESPEIAPDVTWSESVSELRRRLDALQRQLDDPTM